MNVKAYQQALKSAGFDPGPIDGIRGPKTIAAVRAFQAAKGLAVDGIVGPKTTAAFGGGGGAAAATPAVDTINQQTLAEQFGYALSVLKSDPELNALFTRAVAQTYDQTRFNAELMATGWYKKHGETWRNATTQKSVDPATYSTKVAQNKTRIGMLATQMGAAMSPATLAQMAETSYMFGWDDNQLQASMGKYVTYVKGDLLGQAGQWDTELRAFAADNNIKFGIESPFIQANLRSVSEGKQTFNDVKNKIRDMAISAYPNLAERLRQGETVATIAEPYKQSMATILELNPESLTLGDPKIQKALITRDKAGAPVMQTLYDFETGLRQDPRWLKTKNSQDATVGTAHKILQDLGLMGA